MLPVSNLLAGTLPCPLDCKHGSPGSRRNSLPPDQTASGPRAGARGAKTRKLMMISPSAYAPLPLETEFDHDGTVVAAADVALHDR